MAATAYKPDLLLGAAMTMTSPADTDLISIITPTYNWADLLRETIEGVLEQDYPHWEMLIVDDGSTDNTLAVLAEYQKKDARIISLHQENQGAAAARNLGIQNAAGRYLTFLDSDDVYFPQALNRLWDAIKNAPAPVKLVYGDFTIFDEEKGISTVVCATPPFPRPRLYFQFLVAGGNPIVPSASIAERNAVVEIGMFDSSFQFVEDAELFMRLIRKYDIQKVDAQIVRYRRHRDQITKKLGQRRYKRDLASFHFFNSLSMAELFPGASSDHELSIQLEQLAKKMLILDNLKADDARNLMTFDTALSILKLAQEKHFRTKRERFIKDIEKNIPSLLRQYFDTDLRIETAHLHPKECSTP